MHFVIYLPSGFYSAIASTLVETLQAINTFDDARPFTFEFVSPDKEAISRSGIIFRAKKRPTKKIDVLVLLTGLGSEIAPTPDLLEEEARRAGPLIKTAQKQGATLAATCGAAWLLAASGVLDRRRATISWWLKKEARQRFPLVRWEPSRIVVRDKGIYTCGGGFSGLELITTLLVDLGFSRQERRVRKLMVLPPSRQFQSPYEIPEDPRTGPIEAQLKKLAKDRLEELSIPLLAKELRMSPRTLARKFFDEMQISPGKWIQQQRIDKAKVLLEETKLTISEVCYRIGYENLASFSRLFSRVTGMGPVEFRKML